MSRTRRPSGVVGAATAAIIAVAGCSGPAGLLGSPAPARQQQQIDLLQGQFRALYQQLRSAASTAAESDPLQEIPPHY